MKKFKERVEPTFSLTECILALVVILGLLGFLIIVEKQEPQAPLLIAFVILMLYGRLRGFKWDTIIDGMRTGLRAGVDPLVIFQTIGVLIATWIFSGTIPTIMYFGFKIISVKFFLPTVFIVCTLVGIACGSSFTSISTMGIAFIGISATLHISLPLTAGAIVSGGNCFRGLLWLQRFSAFWDDEPRRHHRGIRHLQAHPLAGLDRFAGLDHLTGDLHGGRDERQDR